MLPTQWRRTMGIIKSILEFRGHSPDVLFEQTRRMEAVNTRRLIHYFLTRRFTPLHIEDRFMQMGAYGFNHSSIHNSLKVIRWQGYIYDKMIQEAEEYLYDKGYRVQDIRPTEERPNYVRSYRTRKNISDDRGNEKVAKKSRKVGAKKPSSKRKRKAQRAMGGNRP